MEGKTIIGSEELVQEYADLLTKLKMEGLGDTKIKLILEDEHGIHTTRSKVRTALKNLGMERVPAIRAATVIPRGYRMAVEDDYDPDERPIEDLIADRVKAAERKIRKAKKHKRNLTLPAEPVAIAVFGDPHVDNEGCDWGQLTRDIRTVQQTEGVLGACVGDMQDNWIGRLGRLYSEASVTASSGWRLSKWMLDAVQWIAIVGGNHDAWANGPGVDPLEWLSKACGVQCYAPDELRITLSWRGRPDLEPVIWIIRHDFGGRSWYHPTHGPNKEAMLDGKCNILTAGHIHQWGQLTTEQRHGRVTHAVRVRGYKRNDTFARSKGFAEQTHGACCLIIIDPEGEEPNRVSVHWDLEKGCDYLTWLRSREDEGEE